MIRKGVTFAKKGLLEWTRIPGPFKATFAMISKSKRADLQGFSTAYEHWEKSACSLPFFEVVVRSRKYRVDEAQPEPDKVRSCSTDQAKALDHVIEKEGKKALSYLFGASFVLSKKGRFDEPKDTP